MHKPVLSQLVYNAIFPRPRTNEPSTFASLITRHLVPEVRIETSTFYGTLDCIEAQYPGLDYSFPPHRMRLGRFAWHQKLFKAFDELGLTEAEIASLCRWEGTKWARDRYERDKAVQVRDTTTDNIRCATPPLPPSVYIHKYVEDSPRNHQLPDLKNEDRFPELEIISELHSREEDEEETSDDGDEMESYGVTLNQRLLQAAEARQQGADVSLDEDWEQWLKEASEHNAYTGMLHAIRSGRPLNVSLTNVPLHSPPSSSDTAADVRSHGASSASNSSRPVPMSNRRSGSTTIRSSIAARSAVDSSSNPAPEAAR
ncbi:conserved hypothetical protein [Histoplasma capsulatum G186AR]|uniref:Uncharacterized protein n=2 Tax=Ajellomyces capsulatus TaxID=5037 RepID=C0NCF1_AJECG|nr:uncharacterized protein HCBG_00797 [Histoplasma capsulatum G186AR]EEH11342.1 conserved hypothetical protein [Histoplasma capsulatum G186AR]KAG5302813.1 hypothetical protein I7I52_00568 [Histoplasma capsulatum]QSS71787.1 hypothetical protein I7I50_02766 [Histoplasma capsulatum G186AR]